MQGYMSMWVMSSPISSKPKQPQPDEKQTTDTTAQLCMFTVDPESWEILSWIEIRGLCRLSHHFGLVVVIILLTHPLQMLHGPDLMLVGLFWVLSEVDRGPHWHLSIINSSGLGITCQLTHSAVINDPWLLIATSLVQQFSVLGLLKTDCDPIPNKIPNSEDAIQFGPYQSHSQRCLLPIFPCCESCDRETDSHGLYESSLKVSLLTSRLTKQIN